MEEIKNLKVLVTGATGFVGSHLCEKLTEMGADVYALARSKDKFEEFNVKGKLILGNLESNKKNKWVKDLPDDINAVVHTAGIVHHYNTCQFFKINAHGTKQLIKDLKERNAKLKFVLISSLAAGGPTKKKPLKESDAPRPVSMYGHSKLSAEDFLKELAPKNWDKVILRPPMVIGPRDPAILDIFKMISKGHMLVAGLKGLENEYSFVCVYDLVDSILHILNGEKSFKTTTIYYSSYPKKIKFGQLVSTIQEALDKNKILKIKLPHFIIKIVAKALGLLSKFINISARLTPDKYNEIKASKWTCSSKKISEELGVSYKWDIKSTIEITAKDYKLRDWI